MDVKTKILFIIITFLFILIKQGWSQDIHFSSLGFNHAFFNPALTGVMNNTFRLSTIYRNQWQTVSPGYNTFFAMVEMQPYLSLDNDKGVGVGLSFTNDVAGSLSYGERDIALSASYFFALDRKNKTYLSFGLQAMRKNWNMNMTNAQFNPNGIYDDNITYQNLTTYDVSFGSALQHAQDEKHLLHISLALFHLNTPTLSRFNDSQTKMHRRLFANASYLFPFKDNDRFSLNPQIAYQHQHNYNEIIFGGDLVMQLSDAIFVNQILALGLYCRNLESIIISPKFKFNGFNAGMSYDVNISHLSKVSKTYGAVELWVSYAFTPLFNRQKQTKIPCSIF